MSGLFLLLSMLFMTCGGLEAVGGLLADGGRGVRRNGTRILLFGALCLLCFLCYLICGGV